MILAIHTDAWYLSEPNYKSQAAGHFFLTCHDDPNTPNGQILTLSTIIKHVLASASKAK